MKRTSGFLMVIFLCCTLLTACSNKDETLVPADLAALGLDAGSEEFDPVLADALLPKTISVYGYEEVAVDDSTPKRADLETTYAPYAIANATLDYGYDANGIIVDTTIAIVDEDIKNYLDMVLSDLLVDYNPSQGLPKGQIKMGYDGKIASLLLDLSAYELNPERLPYVGNFGATSAPAAIRLALEYDGSGMIDLIVLSVLNSELNRWDEVVFYDFAYESNEDGSLAAIEGTIYAAGFGIPACRTEFEYTEGGKTASLYRWTEIARKPVFVRYSGSPYTADGYYWSQEGCDSTYGWLKMGIIEYTFDAQARINERIFFSIYTSSNCGGYSGPQLTDPAYDNAPMVDWNNNPIRRNGRTWTSSPAEPYCRTVNNYDENGRLVRIDIYTEYDCEEGEYKTIAPEDEGDGEEVVPPVYVWPYRSAEVLFTFGAQGNLVRIDINEIDADENDNGWSEEVDLDDSYFVVIDWATVQVPEMAIEALLSIALVPTAEELFDTYLISLFGLRFSGPC